MILIGKLSNEEWTDPMTSRSNPPTLGEVMRGIRTRNGWTLKEMSARSGIPVSTLSKVEHDRLTLSYDKLQQLSQRLNIRMSDLFAEDAGDSAPRVTGRRSVGTIPRAQPGRRPLMRHASLPSRNVATCSYGLSTELLS